MNATVLDEATRDRLLRRVDWRFLLPTPPPVKAAVAADDLLARAVACVVDEVVALVDAAAGSCDLVVLRDPDAGALTAAHNALRSGGACYAEWSSPLSGRSGARMLERAGFDAVHRYWPWPAPSRQSPRFWLPLDAPAALDYFLATRHERRPTTGRGEVVASAWRLARRLGFLAPICTVSVKPGAAEAIERPARLLLTGGERSVNKIVALTFADAEEAPRVAVKLVRLPEEEAALEREAASLRAVAAAGTSAAAAAPQVLFLERCDGVLALGETVRTGRPLSLLLTRSTMRELALVVTDWLARLAEGRPRQRPSEWWDRLAEPALADFARSFAPVVADSELAETRRILSGLGELPVVCEHRDCSPWNLLLSADGELFALDWESAEPRGLPVLDLAYFLAYTVFFVDDAMESRSFRESYAAALDPTTDSGRVVDECLRRYCDRVGVDAGGLRALRLLAWLVHSRSEHRRLAEDAAGPPAAAALRRSVFLALWEEDLRRGPS